MPSKVEENLPLTNEGYGTQTYWEERYSKEAPGTSFDWFLHPTYLLPLITGLIADLGQSARILMLGCGNSELSAVMYDAGYHDIVNIDYSATVIQQMSERHRDRGKMRWLDMDVLDLQFQEEFDVVIDKGTMDAMLTTKGDPWNPPAKDVEACTREVSEALRVLRKRPTSRFIYFTFGQPHFRKRYLANRPSWTLTHRSIGPPEGFEYFLYILSYSGSTNDEHNVLVMNPFFAMRCSRGAQPVFLYASLKIVTSDRRHMPATSAQRFSATILAAQLTPAPPPPKPKHPQAQARIVQSPHWADQTRPAES